MRTTAGILIVYSLLALLGPSADVRGETKPDAFDRIIRETGINKGLIIHIGPVVTTESLARSTGALVHGLEKDSISVKRSRKELDQSDSAGRVTVSEYDGLHLPFVDNVANLIVLTTKHNIEGKEIARVLAPRGIAVAPEGFFPSDIRHSVSSIGDGFMMFTKPVPSDIDDWPHYMHGPDNNAVAADTQVGPPGRLQWTADPKWNRDHDMLPSVSGVISGQGRIFYILDEGPIGAIDKRFPPQFYLRARDAFNGAHLWKRKIENWYLPRTSWGHLPVDSHRRIAADGDSLYVTMGMNQPVSRLDARTGKTLTVYANTRNASEIIVIDGILLVAVKQTNVNALRQQDDNREISTAGFPEKNVSCGNAVIAIDALTGKTLWEVKPGAIPMTMAADNKHVLYAENGSIICKSLKEGTFLWKAPVNARSLVIYKDVVLTATFPRKQSVELRATSLADGKTLWSKTGTHLPSFTMFHIPVDIFVVKDIVWGIGKQLEWQKSGGSGAILGLHYRTGEQVREISAKGAFTAGHHQRCYPNKATENYILTGKRGTEFLGLNPGDKPLKYQWVRGVCRYGVLPCNGLLYAPPHSCVCSPGSQLTGFKALAPQKNSKIYKSSTADAKQGPAFGHWHDAEDPDSWPTYRADTMRRGASHTVLPEKISVKWKTDLGGRISPPVQANGRIYASLIDKHQVAAIDAASGKKLWIHHNGSRVDSPPTVHKGLVIFGCRDGWVTALRDTDGEAAWQFRAAPADRRLIARDQLESVWPVIGSVLVVNDIVYVTAGRSVFLDGGIYMYGLDAKTGRIRHSKHLETMSENGKNPLKVVASQISGAEPRILQADAEQIYMGHVMFDQKLGLQNPPGEAMWTLTPRGQARIFPYSGFLDSTMYSRNYWAFRNVYPNYPQDRGRAQLMVQNGNNLYGIRYFWGRGWNSPVFKAGEGYILYERKADDLIESGDGPHKLAEDHYTWNITIPVRVNAMVAAQLKSETKTIPCLAVAGAPDVVDPKDPLASFEGRKGAVLQIHDVSTGEICQKLSLSSPPVFDGMIAADKSLVISLQNGTIIKVAAKE